VCGLGAIPRAAAPSTRAIARRPDLHRRAKVEGVRFVDADELPRRCIGRTRRAEWSATGIPRESVAPIGGQLDRRQTSHGRHWDQVVVEVTVDDEEVIDLIRVVVVRSLPALEIHTVQDVPCFTVVVLTWMRSAVVPIQTSRS
jgi:hypothetical protein